MKGYELNPDKEYVQKILEGIYKFVEKQICKCNLFVKKQSGEVYKNSSISKK